MFGNLGKMMKIASDMKTKMPALQERLAREAFSADAGEGAVTATVNGKLELVDLKIDPAALGGEAIDTGMLAERIRAAVSSAQANAAAAAKDAMKELTGGLDLPEIEGLIG